MQIPASHVTLPCDALRRHHDNRCMTIWAGLAELSHMHEYMRACKRWRMGGLFLP